MGTPIERSEGLSIPRLRRSDRVAVGQFGRDRPVFAVFNTAFSFFLLAGQLVPYVSRCIRCNADGIPHIADRFVGLAFRFGLGVVRCLAPGFIDLVLRGARHAPVLVSQAVSNRAVPTNASDVRTMASYRCIVCPF